MSYLDSRSASVAQLHNVYSKDIPEYLIELLDLPEFRRIADIDINAGINMSGFKIYDYKYSVLDHALGTALILNNFVTNKKQILAAILHDIAVPAFTYSSTYIEDINFDAGDEPLSNYDIIVGSDKLFGYFFKNDININEMCDYSKFPLAYNIRPMLCAHSLESVLHDALLSNLCSIDEIREFYNDLYVVPNKDNMPEFCFNTPQIAEKFCLTAIECGKVSRSYDSKATMKFIADTLAPMIRRGIIKRKDLYTSNDKTILEIGLNCSDKRISDRWRYLPNLNKVYTKFNQDDEKYSTKISKELEYIDPLVRYSNGYSRLSFLDAKCNRKINEFIDSDTDLFMYVDYEN